MAARAICVALLLSTLPAAGCGTAANLARSRPESGGRTPFGGVRHDLAAIQQAGPGGHGPHAQPKAEGEHLSREALVFFCALDLPLSLVGDILTWPYTVTYTRINAPTDYPPVTLAPPPVVPIAAGVPDAPLPRMPAPTPPGPEVKPANRPVVPPPSLPPPRKLPDIAPPGVGTRTGG